MKHLMLVVLSTFLTLTGVWSVSAQTTAFTYQGRLTDGADAANGTYEMEFRLFDALESGAQIGSTVTNNSVTVANGIFTVTLDFGSSPFATGSNRWLEIGVRKASDPPGFTPLAPRQPITSSPYAIKTISAGSADSLSPACVGCVTDAQINAISGAKVTGAVADATNAVTATTAGNVTGIVNIINGGTGSATKSFVDLSTNQTGIGGNKSFTGTVDGTFTGNGAGLTGVVRVFTLYGEVADNIAGNSVNYVFIGPTVSITTAVNDRVSATLTTALGTNSFGSTGAFRLDVCYRLTSNPAAIPISVAGFNYVDQKINSNGRFSYTTVGSTMPGAGTWLFGACVRNTSANTLNDNDWLNGVIMVTKN